MTERTGFDVVIVGGGPAGAVLAHRLTADPDRNVLLVEAGPDYGDDVSAWPAELLFSQQQPLTSHSWGLHDAGNGMFLPRARILGGSSAVNACYWIRGSARDFDDWEALGNPGWGFDDLLPYFRRAETDPIGGPLHGSDGPVQVSGSVRVSGPGATVSGSGFTARPATASGFAAAARQAAMKSSTCSASRTCLPLPAMAKD